jgi:pyruvate kinase
LPQPYVSEFGSLLPRTAGSVQHLNRILLTHAPYMTKLESLASSATRTAEKINAGLIIVMVQSGRTVSLVSKYRPPMPIMVRFLFSLLFSRRGVCFKVC